MSARSFIGFVWVWQLRAGYVGRADDEGSNACGTGFPRPPGGSGF